MIWQRNKYWPRNRWNLIWCNGQRWSTIGLMRKLWYCYFICLSHFSGNLVNRCFVFIYFDGNVIADIKWQEQGQSRSTKRDSNVWGQKFCPNIWWHGKKCITTAVVIVITVENTFMRFLLVVDINFEFMNTLVNANDKKHDKSESNCVYCMKFCSSCRRKLTRLQWSAQICI